MIDALSPENHARLIAQIRHRDEIIIRLREKTTTNNLLRMLALDILGDAALPEKYQLQARKALGLRGLRGLRRGKRGRRG